MLRVFGLDDEVLWRDIVKSFARHDVYHLPEYTKAFRLHGDGEPQLFYYESDETRAVNVVMKRDIAALRRSQAGCPKPPVTTPRRRTATAALSKATAAAAMDRLNAAYTEYCLTTAFQRVRALPPAAQ